MATADCTVIYRDIAGFPGYRVGNDGSVWSCWHRVGLGRPHGTRTAIDPTRWKPLKLMRRRTGYLEVALRRDGSYAYRLVHRLVLEAFIGPCPEGMECRHRDGNRANNVPANLHWGTRRDNILDKFTHGTMLVGEKANGAKLTADAVRSMRARYAAGGVTQTDLASEFGIAQTAVSEIIRRNRWKHVE